MYIGSLPLIMRIAYNEDIDVIMDDTIREFKATDSYKKNPFYKGKK